MGFLSPTAGCGQKKATQKKSNGMAKDAKRDKTAVSRSTSKAVKQAGPIDVAGVLPRSPDGTNKPKQCNFAEASNIIGTQGNAMSEHGDEGTNNDVTVGGRSAGQRTDTAEPAELIAATRVSVYGGAPQEKTEKIDDPSTRSTSTAREANVTLNSMLGNIAGVKMTKHTHIEKDLASESGKPECVDTTQTTIATLLQHLPRDQMAVIISDVSLTWDPEALQSSSCATGWYFADERSAIGTEEWNGPVANQSKPASECKLKNSPPNGAPKQVESGEAIIGRSAKAEPKAELTSCVDKLLSQGNVIAGVSLSGPSKVMAEIVSDAALAWKLKIAPCPKSEQFWTNIPCIPLVRSHTERTRHSTESAGVPGIEESKSKREAEWVTETGHYRTATDVPAGDEFEKRECGACVNTALDEGLSGRNNTVVCAEENSSDSQAKSVVAIASSKSVHRAESVGMLEPTDGTVGIHAESSSTQITPNVETAGVSAESSTPHEYNNGTAIMWRELTGVIADVTAIVSNVEMTWHRIGGQATFTEWVIEDPTDEQSKMVDRYDMADVNGKLGSRHVEHLRLLNKCQHKADDASAEPMAEDLLSTGVVLRGLGNGNVTAGVPPSGPNKDRTAPRMPANDPNDKCPTTKLLIEPQCARSTELTAPVDVIIAGVEVEITNDENEESNKCQMEPDDNSNSNRVNSTKPTKPLNAMDVLTMAREANPMTLASKASPKRVKSPKSVKTMKTGTDKAGTMRINVGANTSKTVESAMRVPSDKHKKRMIDSRTILIETDELCPQRNSVQITGVPLHGPCNGYTAKRTITKLFKAKEAEWARKIISDIDVAWQAWNQWDQPTTMSSQSVGPSRNVRATGMGVRNNDNGTPKMSMSDPSTDNSRMPMNYPSRDNGEQPFGHKQANVLTFINC